MIYFPSILDKVCGELRRELAAFEALIREGRDGRAIQKQGRKVTLIAQTVGALDPNGRNYKEA